MCVRVKVRAEGCMWMLHVEGRRKCMLQAAMESIFDLHKFGRVLVPPTQHIHTQNTLMYTHSMAYTHKRGEKERRRERERAREKAER